MGAKTTPGPPPASLRTQHNTTYGRCVRIWQGPTPSPFFSRKTGQSPNPSVEDPLQPVSEQKSEAHIPSFQIRELTQSLSLAVASGWDSTSGSEWSSHPSSLKHTKEAGGGI